MTTFLEDAEYEANARFDYVREAYAASGIDGASEVHGEYVSDCLDQGIEPLSLAGWLKANPIRVAIAPVACDDCDATSF